MTAQNKAHKAFRESVDSQRRKRDCGPELLEALRELVKACERVAHTDHLEVLSAVHYAKKIRDRADGKDV